MTAPHAITCPSCGGSIELRAAGYTVSLACRYCGALLDVANPEVRLLAAAAGEVAALLLPLGTRGTLIGTEWEVIGWQSREAEGAGWEEFLLFNPYAGYRWLVHADTQWQLGAMITDLPQWTTGDNVRWRGHVYETEGAAVAATTTRVLGEFYWRVRTGDSVQAASFARGMETLSLEVDADEINWTHLVSLSPAALHAAFPAAFTPGGAPRRGPADSGPAAAAPAWWNWSALDGSRDSDLGNMWLVSLFALTLLLGAMLWLGRVSQIVPGAVDLDVDAPGKIVPLGTITVPGVSRAVTITASSDQNLVDNWVDFDVTLVDRRTQRAIPASGTLEYYAGHDSDGDWSEGSHTRSVTIASVPAGTYDVWIDAEAHHWNDPKSGPVPTPAGTDPWGISTGTPGLSLHVWLNAQVGGFAWGMYLTVLALITAPPLIVGYIRLRKRRA